MKAKLNILTVFGTRPEVIKMAPVIAELRKYPESIDCRVCVSAQHRQMIDPLLKLFGIRADYDLNVMKENQTLKDITNSVMDKIDGIIQEGSPDYLLVQGDTTTAMSAALAAFYRKVKVGHVEAGLRTWDKLQPYPEEVNRKIIDSVSDLYFAHTPGAKKNLITEGVKEELIEVTGNTVIDALLDTVEKKYNFDGLLPKAVLNGKRLILVTAHRRESFGEQFLNICHAIKEIANFYKDEVNIVYPVHLNPNVKKPAEFLLRGLDNVFLLEPLEYLPFVHLMKRAYLILTDSGGIQEEAPSLAKPVLVMRQVTERPEAALAGVVRIIGTERESIVRNTIELLEEEAKYKEMARGINPYGDGKASQRIVARLLKQ